MSIIICSFIIITSTSVFSADKLKLFPYPAQNINVRYRLFYTQNMWSFLLLDTAYGKVWKCQYTVKGDKYRFKTAINLIPLVPSSKARTGRFTLYPTDNMWNFLMVDQFDGRVWQVQYSTEADKNFILQIQSADEMIDDLFKKIPKEKKHK